MAILNYASKLSGVLNYIGKSVPAGSAGDYLTGDFAKLIFTGDGHIITHGVDYTPTFIGGNKRGLVPEVNADNGYTEGRLNFLGHDGKWKQLSVSELPIAENISVGGAKDGSGANYIYTAKQVYDNFNAQISAVDAMRFKGSIKANDNSTYPTSCEAGDTYRVEIGGTFAGKTVAAGDLVICIKDQEAGVTNINTAEYWMVVETNINGTVTHKVNNQGFEIYTPNIQGENITFDIFAPTKAGNKDQILISLGNNQAPTWIDQSALMAGVLTDDLKKVILTDVNIAGNGVITGSFLDGSTTTHTISGGTWNINISGVAGSVAQQLKLTDGLSFIAGEDYNGSVERTIKLNPAKYGAAEAAINITKIGGVIIDGLGKTNGKQKDGNTISVTENGNIFITPENIENALGFMPGNTSNVYSYKAIFTDTASNTGSAVAVDPFFNFAAKREDAASYSVASSTQFVGTNGIKVQTLASGALNFDLQVASDSSLGGIKIGYTEDNAARLYPVLLDADNRAYVHVDWKDESDAFSTINVVSGQTSGSVVADQVKDSFTLNAGNGINLSVANDVITINQNIWEVVSHSKMGYVPTMAIDSNKTITKDHFMLSFVGEGGAADWYRLPATAFSDTWRSIKVNSQEILTSEVREDDVNGAITGLALNFVSAGKTNITGNASTGDITISSTWRDIKVNGQSIDQGSDTPAFNIITSDDIFVNEKHTETEHTVSLEILWFNIDTDSYENDIVNTL